MADTHYAEPGRMEGDVQEDPDLARLCGYFEEAEDAQREAREKAERDRDYVDNKQLTQEEVDALRKRGQPPIVLNVIRSRASFLGGMEKKQRRDPKAYPRNNPEDANAAEAFTDGLRYCTERADYASKRSQAWKNIVIEGFGALELAATPKRDGSMEFEIRRIQWDRAFYDPHSAEPDFTDAKYLGQAVWMDYDDALRRAVQMGAEEAEARAALDATLRQSPGTGRTYDDRPRDRWADRKRKRVRFLMLWENGPNGWCYYEFTKGGIFAKTEAPYVDTDGDSYCPWIFESANVDRENNRYGEIRHLIDPQDEVNKRRSKALHLLNTNGVIADEGAVDDIGAARRELARPDFWLKKNPGRELEIVKGTDLAAGQAQLGAQAMQYILEAGPNGALLGKGVQDQSGRAIEAQQAGGLVEQSDLMDVLRRLDLRVFTTLAKMMQQFWDGPMWVRVTDDEEAPRWVGFNQPLYVDTATGEAAPKQEWRQRIESGEPVGKLIQAANDDGSPRLHNDVARLDMDILVSDAPDSITLDGETYTAFTQLLSLQLPPPMLKIAIEMHPGLTAKRKKQLVDLLDQMAEQPNPQRQEQDRLNREMAEAKIAETRAKAYSSLTQGEERMAKIAQPVMDPPRPDVSEGLSDDAGPGGPQGPMSLPGQPGPGPQPPPGDMPPPEPIGVPQGPPQGPPMGGMMTGPRMVA